MLATNLNGKLFLIHGDMDDNVASREHARLVDALIKAGKTFDHADRAGRGAHDVLPALRAPGDWDYFVRHLRHEEPPAEYVVGGPPPAP